MINIFSTEWKLLSDKQGTTTSENLNVLQDSLGFSRVLTSDRLA